MERGQNERRGKSGNMEIQQGGQSITVKSYLLDTSESKSFSYLSFDFRGIVLKALYHPRRDGDNTYDLMNLFFTKYEIETFSPI